MSPLDFLFGDTKVFFALFQIEDSRSIAHKKERFLWYILYIQELRKQFWNGRHIRLLKNHFICQKNSIGKFHCGEGGGDLLPIIPSLHPSSAPGCPHRKWEKIFRWLPIKNIYLSKMLWFYYAASNNKKNFILDMIGNKSYSYTGICEKCIVLLYMYIFINKYTSIILYKKKLWFSLWKKYQTNTKQKQLGVLKSKLYNITSEPNLGKYVWMKNQHLWIFFLNSL